MQRPGSSQRRRTSPVTNAGSGPRRRPAPLERREPQAVVHQLGVAGLEPGLLVGQVPLQGEVLEVGVGHQQGQGPRALVHLPALDADPTVLDHVDAAPAVGTHDPVDLADQPESGMPLPVERHRQPLLEADDQLGGARWPSGSSARTPPRAAVPRGPPGSRTRSSGPTGSGRCCTGWTW